MKKLVLNLLALAVMTTSVFTSCKDDKDDPIVNSVTEDLKTGLMKGKLAEDYTLNASMEYKLKGAFIVEDGATLTIPAGTKIVADNGGTDVYIAIMMGGKIDINGTASNPVVMSTENGEPGEWGGLTICGKATTTSGANSTAEVGGFVYGGTEDEDSSGSIKYLVIKGTGAQITEEAQYNGISFYAVGSKTLIENVAVINGSDDGVEFFGGTVSVKNLFLQNNEDDAIDWTEGWSGTVENAYVEHTIPGFSTVVEGDKVNNNPKIINLTAVSTVGGTALQFKAQSGATITGLSLSGYEKNIDMKDSGSLSNVKIDGVDADPTKKYDATATVDVSGWTWTNAGVSTKLTGSVIGNIVLDPTIEYSLTGSYIVQDGGSLTIPAGTKITAAAKGTSVYIAVLMGGKINIQGTASKPVIISSPNAEPGDWGGLTICGKSTTTSGANSEAEVGGFIYGGSDVEDNSGSIEYLVIKGTGAQINEESQYNGLSLYAVGSKTTISNVAIINGSDDGVEFFGGTVSVGNIYLENNEDDAVDWTEGWSGSVTNTYISHTVKGFSTAFEGDKANGNPKFENVTAISTVGGTALQFKSVSGATITTLHLTGYDVDLDMKDSKPTSSVIIGGNAADATLLNGESHKYMLNSGKDGAAIDISDWNWKNASL